MLNGFGEKEIWGVFECEAKLFSALSHPKDDGSIFEMASTPLCPGSVIREPLQARRKVWFNYFPGGLLR